MYSTPQSSLLPLLHKAFGLFAGIFLAVLPGVHLNAQEPVAVPPVISDAPAIQARPVTQAQPLVIEENRNVIESQPMTDVETGFQLGDPAALEMPATLPTEAVAVEIPAEIQGKPVSKEEDTEMAVDATVEEEVAAEDSTVMKIGDSDPNVAPVKAVDLREKSTPTKPGQLGSSILTRTEARTFTFSIPAPRGQILDRNGYPLAQSKVSYYAALTFPFLGDNVENEKILQYAGERIIHVNNILGSEWDLPGKTVVEHYRKRRWFPLTFSSVLTEIEIDELSRQKMEGLTLHPVYMRHYPQNEVLSHVLGYVGKRPPRSTGEIINDEPLWGTGVGVDGLEKAYESDLRGTPGRVNVLFEGDGTKIKEDVLARPKPGYNVVTSIDLEMQKICESLLAERVKRGAMVVMDCRTGDVLAMASYPQFNPNDFIPSISQDKYSALVNDPEKPLYPRAYRGSYPPASTYKVPVALGFLESGFLSPRDMYGCPSSWTIGNLTMRNWNTKGEGSMNVVNALARSCNTWFYEVAINGGADTMSSMSTRLGLGMKTGLPLNESEGFIPSNRWWLTEYGHGMSDGDEAVMSIGQGKVETTPIQIARMMAAIGNGEQVLKPRLVLQIQDMNNELERTFPVEMVNSLNVDPYALSVVRKGMYNVVNSGNGTGKRAYHKITVAGKTGTGQWKPAQKQNIAWFAGFAPAKFPIYSFAVIYEGEPGESVSGGKKAAPVVGEFLKQYLTDDHYTEVIEASKVLREAAGESVEEYVAQPVSNSIFRTSEAAAEI